MIHVVTGSVWTYQRIFEYNGSYFICFDDSAPNISKEAFSIRVSDVQFQWMYHFYQNVCIRKNVIAERIYNHIMDITKFEIKFSILNRMKKNETK